MSLLFKTVPDTNVVLAAEKSKSSTSPNKEYIAHWLEGRVDLLYSEDTLLEYVEKLNSESIDEDRIVELLTTILKLGKPVDIEFYHLPLYPKDPEDIAFILCADNGKATHLLSYDSHFDPLKGSYSFKICKPLDFLFELRESLNLSS